MTKVEIDKKPNVGAVVKIDGVELKNLLKLEVVGATRYVKVTIEMLPDELTMTGVDLDVNITKVLPDDARFVAFCKEHGWQPLNNDSVHTDPIYIKLKCGCMQSSSPTFKKD